MPNGYNGVILRVDLSEERAEEVAFPEEFYRTYMGGGAIGAFFLLRETSADMHPMDPQNVFTLAPSVTTGCAVSGVSRCSVVAISPLTGAVAESQAGGDLGPAIKLAGYDAIAITGRAKAPVFLLVEEGELQVRSAADLAGRTVSEVYDALNQALGDPEHWLSVVQCGPAGEKGVRFACLMAGRNHVFGRTGLGAVLGGKNLRAVAVRAPRHKDLDVADLDGLRELARLAGQRLPDADFPSTLREYGTPGIVGFQAEAGNMATHNYSRGQHEDYKNLTGQVFEQEIGAGKTTCYGCVVACRKRVKVDEPYRVSDKLGGPEFETLSTLGTNLDITEAAAVAKANERCNEYGIDTITMGALAAYLFESTEQGAVQKVMTDGRALSFGSAEDLLWLIERVAQREGVGDILANGFGASIAHFGPATAPYAVHCKGQGLPAHLAQVKPSQALMYAVCPVGGDHMSSEHDWLLAGGGELALLQPPRHAHVVHVRVGTRQPVLLSRDRGPRPLHHRLENHAVRTDEGWRTQDEYDALRQRTARPHTQEGRVARPPLRAIARRSKQRCSCGSRDLCPDARRLLRPHGLGTRYGQPLPRQATGVGPGLGSAGLAFYFMPCGPQCGRAVWPAISVTSIIRIP